ncbi:MAG: helix-turn-helix domain-containing protein, partial [Chloroflexota bacterium]|nr:helix-turn-helix domain-containing protein [Chloroflexota bacterium]
MEDLAAFADWLKRRRRALDLTQSELAAAANCSPVSVKKMEAGDLKPSRQLAELLAVALHIPAAEGAAFVDFARGTVARFQLQPILPQASLVAAPVAPASLSQAKLPAQLTAVIGRERETIAAVQLLRQPPVRLITLTGPPGTGKTRLSLEIGQALQEEWKDGVYFVPLAPVSQASLVPAAIAQALGIVEERDKPLLISIQTFLHAKTLLLVLDNFEQVSAAAGLVGELLVAAQGLKVLVSSREPLRIYGEHEFPVPPLSLPDVNRLPPLEALILYPAIKLFVERAQAVRPTFQLTSDNAEAVARVCAWLDGLPLAIEMAAAQTKWMTPQKVLTQISGRLTALAGGLRDLSPRQQTLRGAIDWSYNLLDPEECHLFNHLSVFVDGCTIEAVAAVVEDEMTGWQDDEIQ